MGKCGAYLDMRWKRNFQGLLIQGVSLALLIAFPGNVALAIVSLGIICYASLHAHNDDGWDTDLLLSLLVNRWTLTYISLMFQSENDR